MTDPQHWVAPTYRGLADVLEAGSEEVWGAPTLCEGWHVRHLVAHVTMPARLGPAEFGAEMVAAGGDFGVLSETVARRDARLPVPDLLDQLRSPGLHAWQPPGGGADGALSHAVIHSLDVTLAMDAPAVAPPDAVRHVLDQLTAAGGATFGVDLAGLDSLADDPATRVALAAGRALPDGRRLPRA